MSRNRTTLGSASEAVLPALIANLRLLAARKWVLLGSAAVLCALAAIFVFFIATPIYRAKATLLIEPNLATVVDIKDVYGRPSGDREYFQTQIEFIRSRPVIERVVDRLGLATHPLLDPRQAAPSRSTRLLSAIGITMDADADNRPISADMARESVVESVRRQLTVVPVRLSQLLDIRFESTDPALAAQIANEVADAYIAQEIQFRASASRQASNLLEQQITELQVKLDASERALQAYLEKNDLLDRASESSSGVSQQLGELSKRLIEARAQRAAAELAWKQVSGRSAATAPQVLANAEVARARTALAEAEREAAQIGDRYGSAHPARRAAATRLEAARHEVSRLIGAIADGARKDYEAALAAERALEREQGRTKQSIQGDNRKQIERETLEREVNTNRTLYQTLLARRKETEASRELQAAGARLIEAALAPNVPVKPNRRLTLGLAAFLGLFGAGAWTLVRGRLDDTIRRRSQVDELLGQSVLSAMPKLPPAMLAHAGRVVSAYPNTVQAEAIRDAAAGVLLSMAGNPHPVIAVTSTLPDEGKTTFISNLALSLANYSSKKVLLIEGDMRKPRLAQALGLEPRDAGLSGVLAGTERFSESFSRVEGSTLIVMPCGRVPSNPVARLQPARLGRHLALWRKAFDIVLIDCPPVQLVSDALLIGRQADAIIYVVKSGETVVPLVRQGLERLAEAKITVLGVALNHHDFEQAERYYGEYSAHGRYGDDYYGSDGADDAGGPVTRFAD